jgi:hypothetical protein
MVLERGRRSTKPILHACRNRSGAYAGVRKLRCHYIDWWDWHWLCVRGGVDLLAFSAILLLRDLGKGLGGREDRYLNMYGEPAASQQ